MLQQTQVERVKEFFVRWVVRWPTVAALAQATQEEVNTCWAGLGFYRRARFLLQGAQHCVAKHGGRLPADYSQLLAIPGVGPYTAAAVASIAFAAPRCAAVDGNVVRVLSRLHAYGGDAAKGAGARAFQAMADSLLHPVRGGDHNQAMMELGATVCTPQRPRCGGCPVRDHCAALRADAASVTAFPAKAAKAAKREEAVATAVVQASWPGGSAFLLTRRPAAALLGSLWEFPSVASLAAEPPAARLGALATCLRSRLGLPAAAELLGTSGEAASEAAARIPCWGTDLVAGEARSVGTVVHVFSHIRQRMDVTWCSLKCARQPAQGVLDDARWVDAAAMEEEGLSSGQRKVWDLLVKTRQQWEQANTNGRNNGGAPPVEEATARRSKTKRRRASVAAKNDDDDAL